MSRSLRHFPLRPARGALTAIVVMLFLCGCAARGEMEREIMDGIGGRRLPAGAQRLCGGNVDGGVGNAGSWTASIQWEAYGAPDARSAVASFYQTLFARAPTVNGTDVSWNLGDGLHYALFAPSGDFDWQRCASDHPWVGTVVLVSRMNVTK